MDEKGVSGSFLVVPEENIDSLYPVYFGVSFAFFALRLLPEPEICDDKWLEIRNRMLKGSAHLLGLLVWRVQREVVNGEKSELLHKLENAQTEIEELKKIRSEDAKANERVVSIFAAREQSWFDERKGLRQQIGALMNDLRVLEMKKERSVSELGEKLKETQLLLQSKEKLIDEMEQKRWETEEILKKAEKLAEELRENAKSEAQRHSGEISKHKTAFIEVVSNQRQLEAEMGRAVRQAEAAKLELESVLEQKEQLFLMNQRLSMELVKLHKDLEQRDQILSAMLRKSKVDTAEKQMLLKEAISSKAKRKQAELETARLKVISGSKHERYSLRNMLSKHVGAKPDRFSDGKTASRNHRSVKTDNHLKYHQPEIRTGIEVFSLVSDPYSTDIGGEEQQLKADVEELVKWAEKYKTGLEQRHQLEIDAFAEQLTLKDEKLEALRWRLMSMELESKRLQLHVEGLDHEIRRLRQDNTKLEAVLLDREAELNSLREQLVVHFHPTNPQKSNSMSSPHDAATGRDAVWSKVKVIKRKPGHRRQEMQAMAEGTSQENGKAEENSANERLPDIVFTLQTSNQEIKEERAHFLQERIDSDDVAHVEATTSVGRDLSNRCKSIQKMDIQALGVAYKVKRLKQQLLVLERLMGKKESCENSENTNGVEGFYALMSMLNKQVDRYQSLQGKIDELCKRMNNLNLNSTIARPEVEAKRLEHFLDEIFQLQRYVVATGQKLMEVQAKIASGFVDDEGIDNKPASFDRNRFADSIKTLFQDVQRGLEVRTSRIIGDLEGTLACDGFHTSSK